MNLKLKEADVARLAGVNHDKALPPPTAEQVHYILMLVDCDLDMKTILEWTPKQLAEAEKWAKKSYLKASDSNVRVPVRPAHVTRKTVCARPVETEKSK